METPLPPVPPKLPLEPLPRRKPRITTLRGGVLLTIAGVGVVVLLGGVLLTASRQQAQQRKAQAPQSAPALPTLPSQALAGLPANYAQALTPKPVQATPTTPDQPSPGPVPPVAAGQPPPAWQPPPPPRPLPPPPMPQPAPATTPVQAKKPRRWYTAETPPQSDLMAPPFPDEAEGDPQARQRRASQLFPQATWERPADPTRTIYASQLLHGLLEQAVVTGENSTVRIRMTETLYDKFGQQVPLLPVDTMLLGTVEGNVRFGQRRVSIGLSKAELPDGTDLLLQGKAGDAAGAVGLKGRVNNKYGPVVLSALLTAALSVGSRAATGTPSGFYENPAQEFARDTTQSLNQSGQELVRRSLNVQPEISLPIHTPVTVQLSQNVSLQTPAVIIHK